MPDDFLNDPDVAVIPIPIRIGSHTYMDQHDPAATRQYMRENANGEGASTQSVPLDAEAMKSLFVERFALDYDSVYCLTIAQSRSPIYDAASQGSMLALNAIRAQRQAADISRPFQFRVIDTKQMFAGSGVAPLALQSMLKAGMETRDIRDALYRVIDTSYAYAVPDDLGYARARAKLRGDKSIGMVSALVGGALDIKPVIRVAKGNTVSVGKFRGARMLGAVYLDWWASRSSEDCTFHTSCFLMQVRSPRYKTTLSSSACNTSVTTKVSSSTPCR